MLSASEHLIPLVQLTTIRTADHNEPPTFVQMTTDHRNLIAGVITDAADIEELMKLRATN